VTCTADETMRGQTIVVIGAGSGIGAGVARYLADRQIGVVCADKDLDAADSTAEDAGPLAYSCFADVTEERTLHHAVDEITTKSGQIHGLINCAGVQGPLGRRSHEVTLGEFDQTYQVNLRGALALTRCFIPHMLTHQYGRIAFVASIAGKEGNPNMIGYSATKAGLIGMVKALGKEYVRDGITINALAPSVIQTPFIESQPPNILSYMTDKIPMGRPGTIKEAAQMLGWMVSPACSFTTGAVFDLSGGRATY
jgi:NAD(P)-dependent dehydrogenase (short-subunit alcohol dehydrogenase family)